MKTRLLEKYQALLVEVSKLASGFSAVEHTIQHDDAGIALDVCRVFQSHAVDVLERYSVMEAKDDGAQGGDA